MSWQAEARRTAPREAMARAMGGPDKVKRQHEGGRLTVRERIGRWSIAVTFHEVGAIAGRREYDAQATSRASRRPTASWAARQVDGRPVVVVGDDFTVRGGSADATIREKPIMAERMAAELRLPIVRHHRGLGRRRLGQDDRDDGARQPARRRRRHGLFNYADRNLSAVPVVALGLGSVAGLGAARLAASHYSVMTKASAMFVAGPPVVARLGRAASQAGARRLGDPVPRRRRRRRGRHRGGGVRPAPAAFSPTCRPRCTSLPPVAPCDDDPARRDEALIAPSRATARQPTRCARSSRRWSTRARSSRWGGSSAARSSPDSRASTAGRWR